jgi:hypothetical protein
LAIPQRPAAHHKPLTRRPHCSLTARFRGPVVGIAYHAAGRLQWLYAIIQVAPRTAELPQALPQQWSIPLQCFPFHQRPRTCLGRVYCNHENIELPHPVLHFLVQRTQRVSHTGRKIVCSHTSSSVTSRDSFASLQFTRLPVFFVHDIRIRAKAASIVKSVVVLASPCSDGT